MSRFLVVVVVVVVAVWAFIVFECTTYLKPPRMLFEAGGATTKNIRRPFGCAMNPFFKCFMDVLHHTEILCGRVFPRYGQRIAEKSMDTDTKIIVAKIQGSKGKPTSRTNQKK